MGGLLERDEQLRTVGELIEAARRGRGAFVLVGGEAGAGKSSVVAELARTAGDDVRVLTGYCDPLSTPRPLGPVHDFATFEPEIGALLVGDVTGPELFAGVRRQLGGGRPTLAIVEDAHWADDATLDFLRFVGRRVADTNSVIAVTYRDDEVSADHPLRTVIGQLSRLPSTVRVDIPALSPAALATLAAGTGVDPAHLHRLTGGNAFFATEVLATRHDLPERVQDAVLARLSRLGPDARRVARTVAVAPRSLEHDIVAGITQAPPGAIEEAVESGVLIDDGGALRFRHELARMAVDDGLAPSMRLGLHATLLHILAERPDPDLARLAHHAIGADDDALVAEYGPRAADAAARAESHREAAALFEATIAGSSALPAGRLAELRLRLAEELAMIDRLDHAIEQAELAARHYRDVDHPVRLASTLTELSRAYWRTQDSTAAEGAIDEAIELLTDADEPRELAHAWYQRGYLAMLARRLDAARDAIAHSRQIATDGAIDDPGLRAGQDLIAACNDIIGDSPLSGLAALEDLLGQSRRDGNARHEVLILGMIGSGGAESRLYGRAVEALEECVDLSIATDQDFSLAYSRSWLARAAFEQGRWSEAAELAELVDRTSTHRDGIAMMTAMGVLGRVRVRRGDPGGVTLLRELLDGHGRFELQHVWSPVCGLAESLWLTGRSDEMVDILGETYERALEADSSWARGEVGFWMWRAGAVDGAPDRVAPPFRLQMDGDWAEAARLWREIGCPYETALALADGDEAAMHEALAIFDELGARPVAGWLRSRMRERGVERITRGPRASTRRNPAGLTRRQVDVLELMVEGLSNGEIAEALFVSKKTVEHHVSAIFAKLGVADRPKAIAAARKLGVHPDSGAGDDS